ncbi:hypothetical protein L1280_001620 [Deinococcus sp. HSC-46F16]|uniref:hypothetical protein n=1 Tax=Deinococcus sp. HSC-46F16 TaxID=2910968 RepID=UPI0020A0E8B2|nr:hypothetical protein [Deinococcus sp. HSC-46F16]MCP2014469.1 hypothetical protein [Deinococcus sp. HSC-46F16]
MPKPTLLAALLVGATSLPALAQTAPAQSSPTAEQAAQLVERLLRSMAGPSGDTQVTYGAVPGTLPLRLDAPLEVLASVRTGQQGGGYVYWRILAGSALPAEETRAALQKSLEAGGWKPQPLYGQPIGFATQQTARNQGYYREGGTNFVLNANLVERGGRTEVELGVNVVPAQAIANLKKAPTYRPQSSLPLLKAFPGATVKGGYTPTVPNGAISSAHVQTTRPAGEVFNFYSAQLKAAGWKARTDTADGPLRVVTYSLRDLNGREALGTLGIRPWEKEGGGYVLTVSVQGFKP